MKAKLVILALLAACGYGAYRHYTAGPSAAQALQHVSSIAPGFGSGDMAVIEPGQDLESWREPGRITIIAFVSDHCSAWVQAKPQWRSLLRRRPDAAIRLVDLGRNWKRADGKAKYGQNIRTLPHVLVYDAAGKLLAADNGLSKDGLSAVEEWIVFERNRARQ